MDRCPFCGAPLMPMGSTTFRFCQGCKRILKPLS